MKNKEERKGNQIENRKKEGLKSTSLNYYILVIRLFQQQQQQKKMYLKVLVVEYINL